MTNEELGRLFALIRIPSVGAVPEHAHDMERGAQFMVDEVVRAGGSAVIHRTGGQPFVIGEVAASTGDPNARHVLIYGHYDVQPPGDLERWDSPPFEPTVRGGYLYARGVSDNKGNFFQILCAVQRLRAEGALPVRVTFLIDGEEESGGDSAIRWLEGMPERPDVAVIWDGDQLARDRPSLQTGVRGLLYRKVTVTCGTLDGHSGLFGGVAMNAAHVLGRVLAAVTPVDGRLPQELHAGVGPVSAAERRSWSELPSGAAMLDDAGLVPADAHAADEFAERTMASPSVDVHAIWCGDADAVKTVIPAVAHAMVSIRLAPGQEPAVIGPVFERLLVEAAPPGATVRIESKGDAEPGLMDPAHPMMRAAADAIAAATGNPVTPARTGGTLPIFAAMTALDLPTVMTGFALPDDAIHSPNERMLLENLGTGVRAGMAMLQAFAK